MAAIEVRGLAKQYRLGATVRQNTLREALVHQARWLLGRGPRSQQQREHIWALNDVSFDAEQGEILGIIGRNGSGKTTLLKILSRITEPTQGTARIQGRFRSLLEVGTGFHPELTGRENIFLNGAILGMRRHEIERKFDEIVAFAETERFLDTPVKRYSSGMYVRLAFAVAAHLEPEVLLVDEVLAVGDVAFQRKCVGTMGRAAGEGKTVLVVSHNMSTIFQLCSRCLCLSDGRLVADGPPTQVVQEYLRSDGGEASGSVTFAEESAKDHQILAAKICTTDGQTLDRPLDTSESWVLHISATLRQDLRAGYGLVSIQNERGEVVLVSDNRDSADSIDFERAGRREVLITVPALLTPGKYYVTIGIAHEPVGTMDTRRNVLSFSVADVGGVRPTREGYIYVPLAWRSDG